MTPKQFVNAFRKHGSIKAVSRNEGVSYRQARKAYLEALKDQLMDKEPVGIKPKETVKAPEGRVKALATKVLPVPVKGVTRYLFTCAQNDTKLFMPFWSNLQVLAGYYNAKIHVSRFTYIKSGLGARGDKAQFTKKETYQGGNVLTWDKTLDDYISDGRVEIAPGLVWCGEMNILPTAVRPLSGLEVYTGRKSGIFPHVKIAMESIPSGKHEPTKFNYTTGTVTMRNYIQRKAGLKAEFHHCYGALLVEVDHEGDWFCRQINADSEGTIYDLNIKVANGKLTEGVPVEAINWGDIHVAQIDTTVKYLAWEPDGMLDVLRAKYQFFHDVLDFRSRSHHELKDPHRMFQRFMSGEENLRRELIDVARFFEYTHRDWSASVCIDSNHHHHLARWLKEQDGRRDPINAQIWLALQKAVYEHIAFRAEEPCYLRLALEQVLEYKLPVTFLEEDESFVICTDANGGIECGTHGHAGPNGSRGNTLKFARMGRKMNKGHDHTATITDGIYSAGTCSNLAVDWTHGPSGWSQSHIITYENGKRAIVTMYNGKWRAEDAVY